MEAVRIGYARCSTGRQDLTAQRSALVELECARAHLHRSRPDRRTRARPGLDQALAAVRAGDTLVVTKLDRLARSVPDAREIADQLIAREVKLALGPTTYDPTDPMGRCSSTSWRRSLSSRATSSACGPGRGCRCPGEGKAPGKKPKLSPRQARELRRMYDTGEYSISDLADVFSVSRPTVYRTLRRQPAPA